MSEAPSRWLPDDLAAMLRCVARHHTRGRIQRDAPPRHAARRPQRTEAFLTE